jgi:hypothetical protein
MTHEGVNWTELVPAAVLCEHVLTCLVRRGSQYFELDE